LFWTGRIIQRPRGVVAAFDGVMKLAKPALVVEATVRLGYPESVILRPGDSFDRMYYLYLIPRTSILGAHLVDRLLGGASYSVRVGEGCFSTLPVTWALLILGRLMVSRERLRALIPFSNLVRYSRWSLSALSIRAGPGSVTYGNDGMPNGFFEVGEIDDERCTVDHSSCCWRYFFCSPVQPS